MTQQLSRFGNVYVLALLVAINIVNYADRTLISVLAPAIQLELGLSDSQIGAITGLAFALTYGATGLVLARLSDRYGHSRILVAAIAGWSIMCLLTSYVRSFSQLFMVRLGLGIGESGAGPASLALIHTAFAGRSRTIAFALFSGGTTIGIGTGVAVGGWLGSEFGWRYTTAIMAIPGLLLALTFAFTVKDPGRLTTADAEPTPSPSWVVRDIWADRLRRSLTASYALAAFAYAGFAQWAPTFYMRVHGMTMREVGATYSISSSGGAFLGIILGGVVVGRLMQQNMALALGLCSALAVASGLFSVAAFLVADRTLSLFFFACFGLAAGGTYAPTIALFQERCASQTRAFAAAVMMLVAILLGQGGGPFVIGILSDLFRAKHFAQPLEIALVVASGSLLLSAICLFDGVRLVRQEDSLGQSVRRADYSDQPNACD
jgi:MFS family permease